MMLCALTWPGAEVTGRLLHFVMGAMAQLLLSVTGSQVCCVSCRASCGKLKYQLSFSVVIMTCR